MEKYTARIKNFVKNHHMEIIFGTAIGLNIILISLVGYDATRKNERRNGLTFWINKEAAKTLVYKGGSILFETPLGTFQLRSTNL